MIIDVDKKNIVVEFNLKDDDDAIKYVFSLYNPPLAKYNLYRVLIDTNTNFDFQRNAKIIYLPNKITDEGDYIFYDN
jgi:hypothetical protein